MGANEAWRVTGFMLMVSSWFDLACVEYDWRIACLKLRWFPAVVLTKIMKGENMVSRSSPQYRQICCPRRSTGRTLVFSGCWISFLMRIFGFKSAKVEIWFQLECASAQLVSVLTTNRHFHVSTFFLWYPNLIICYLNMLYFRMICTFAFGKCYSRGGS